MNFQNACKFVKNSKAPDVIQTINFVHETKKQVPEKSHFDSVYKIYCVLKGDGIIHFPYNDINVSEGDVFFTFPAKSYSIESCNDFQYMYISFLGYRALQLIDRIHINDKNSHFKNYFDIMNMWKDSFKLSNSNNLDIISESALLFALSIIEYRTQNETYSNPINDGLLLIKKIIDDNLQNQDLSLDFLSSECSYNKNYISTLFKKNMNVTVKQYINTIRIQAACSLMEKNITCIKDVAYQCGFSDPLYFSKVFKSKMGVSPKEFVANHSKQKSY